MSPLRTAYATAALHLATLVALQVVFRTAYDDRYDAAGFGLDALVRRYLAFWGPGAFDTDPARLLVADLAGAGVLVAVVVLVAGVALRGLARGSSTAPAFLSLWASTIVATVVAGVVLALVRSGDPLGLPLGQVVAVAVEDSLGGLVWGWLPALLGALLWRRGQGAAGGRGPRRRAARADVVGER